MQTILRGALVLGVLATVAPVRAGEREQALAVIEKAIKAHGGAEGLAKAASLQRSGRGVLVRTEGDVPFTSQDVVSLPDRVRLSIRFGSNEILTVLNGDKGWQKPAGGAVSEMKKDQLDEYREVAYVWWLVTLAPLQKDGFTLAPAGEAKVNGRDAVGVKVSRRGHADAVLYFDKQSGLLLKLSHRIQMLGVPVQQEFLYSDHKEFNGVKLPGKEVMTVQGKKWHEITYTDYKFLSRIEDGTFARP